MEDTGETEVSTYLKDSSNASEAKLKDMDETSGAKHKQGLQSSVEMFLRVKDDIVQKLDSGERVVDRGLEDNSKASEAKIEDSNETSGSKDEQGSHSVEKFLREKDDIVQKLDCGETEVDNSLEDNSKASDAKLDETSGTKDEQGLQSLEEFFKEKDDIVQALDSGEAEVDRSLEDNSKASDARLNETGGAKDKDTQNENVDVTAGKVSNDADKNNSTIDGEQEIKDSRSVVKKNPMCKSVGKIRRNRFVDVGKKSAFFKSKTLNELRPFYNGSTLDHRMAEIRKSIYFVRKNWEDFDKFLTSLKQLMLKDGELNFEDTDVQTYMDKLLTTKRTWLKTFEVAFLDITYDAIKLYTSSEGYSRMYRLSNEIFRREDSIDVTETIQNVTFLVELINIDLFNYCLKKPAMSHYEGMVYRGMCLDDADIKAFRSLRQEPMQRRNIAVPLGLFSGSSSLDVALSFIEEGLETREVGKPRQRPLLIKINVINLKQEYIDYYTKRFPTSIISTICAVDVHNLSVFPDEFEVLLRGPFMHILDIYEDRNLLENPCDVLEAVMLNANRDHISVVHLGDQDTPARNLFAAMVAVTRSEFAVKYCDDHRLLQDGWDYQKILRDSRAKLEKLMPDFSQS